MVVTTKGENSGPPRNDLAGTKVPAQNISKTVLDRAFSTKSLNRRVSLQSSYANFQKNFDSPKMAAILNFRFYAKIAKHKNANISKTVLDGELSLKSIAHSQFFSNNSFTYFWKIFHRVKFQTHS